MLCRARFERKYGRKSVRIRVFFYNQVAFANQVEIPKSENRMKMGRINKLWFFKSQTWNYSDPDPDSEVDAIGLLATEQNEDLVRSCWNHLLLLHYPYRRR